MTASGMAALRLAATVAHCLPGVRLRLRHDERTLLVVARPPFEESGNVVSPCVFRRVVARAHEQLKTGTHLSFMGLPEGVDPAVDSGVGVGGRVFPGGIHRVQVGDALVHGFATTLPARSCRRALDGANCGVRLHADAATEVTFVHTVTPVEELPVSPPAALANLLARLVADEVAHALGMAH